MATVNNFEDLEIRKLAREICKDTYKIINYPEFSKDFGLVRQINDSSGSIMDNIAEGFERGGNKEFINFLGIAKGSCRETRSQLYRSLDFEYVSKEEFDNLLQKTIMLSKKLSGFITYLKTSEYKGVKYK